MQQLLSGVLLGALAMVVGGTLFRYRKRLIQWNYEMRRRSMGRFLTEGMRGGDRIMFPVLSVVIFAAGVAMAVWSIYGFVVGRY